MSEHVTRWRDKLNAKVDAFRSRDKILAAGAVGAGVGAVGGAAVEYLLTHHQRAKEKE